MHIPWIAMARSRCLRTSRADRERADSSGLLPSPVLRECQALDGAPGAARERAPDLLWTAARAERKTAVRRPPIVRRRRITGLTSPSWTWDANQAIIANVSPLSALFQFARHSVWRTCHLPREAPPRSTQYLRGH